MECVHTVGDVTLISDTLKQDAYAQETKHVLLCLLTINNDLRLCNIPVEKLPELGENIYGCRSNGQTYIFLPFEIQLPQDDKTGVVTATLKIDNVDRRVTPYARANRQPINMDIQVVTTANLDYIEMEHKDFKLTNVASDCFVISGNISLEYLDLEPYPSGRFTPSGFTGLF